MNPMFSIVIPTYNRADKLKKCLESLLNQTYKNFEVIVCDDGSTDNTFEVTEQLRKQGLKINYIATNQNWGGPARPRNIGIENALAEWICFLDSDDLWLPEKLFKTLPFCTEEYDLIYHSLYVYNGNNTVGKLKARQLYKNAFSNLLINGNAIPTSSVCLKKKTILQFKGFSEDKNIIALEDFDLWIRLAHAHSKFKNIPFCLGYYLLNEDDSITEKSVKQVSRINALYEKYLPLLNTKQRQHAIARKNYLIAKVYDSIGDYKNSVLLYKQAVNTGNFSTRIKSFFFLLTAFQNKWKAVKQKDKI